MPYFNSIKVQFELEPSVFCDAVTEFQFHKGTIWTGRHKSGWVRFCDFNSIKVQFERGSLVRAYRPRGYFNSIKVQFERTKVRKLPQHQINFNSIKVQFEPQYHEKH